MVNIDDYIKKANDWLTEFQRKTTIYFQRCSEYELLAWGGNGAGIIMIITGIILL